MTDDLDKPLARLQQLEQDSARTIERKLAASHRKILHELRREWLTSICKSIFAALIATSVAAAILRPRHHSKPHPE
jgi:hypothetical protein